MLPKIIFYSKRKKIFKETIYFLQNSQPRPSWPWSPRWAKSPKSPETAWTARHTWRLGRRAWTTWLVGVCLCRECFFYSLEIYCSPIHHIAITICPFRFAFSHLPKPLFSMWQLFAHILWWRHDTRKHRQLRVNIRKCNFWYVRGCKNNSGFTNWSV